MSSHSPAMGPVAADNSWRRHIRSTINLGIPFVGAQLAQMAINTTDVIMVGWLGTTELAAIVLASQIFFIVFIFGSGFAAAVVPMVAHAVGRGDVTSVRRAVRMGIWVVLGYGALTAPILWFSESLLLAFGQEPEVSALAQGYLRVAQWGIFPALTLMVLRSFLSGLERGSIILYVTIGMFLANAFLNYALIFGNFGAPAWGLVGAAVASVCASTFGCVLMVAYINNRAETHTYELFVRFWRADWGAIRENLALGLPISFTILAETSLFAAASLMIGTIGTRELAAHGIALQLASLAFMIPLGMAQVATVRIGLAYGRGDMLGVRRAALAVLAVSLCVSVCGSTLFAVMPRELGALFLDTRKPDAQAVLDYAVWLIVIAGIFQMADGLQAVGAGMLRGLKDTKVPMLLALIAYWPIGFACAWLFAFPLGYGGPGVWFGFVTGLGAAAFLLCGRFYLLVRRA
ncbi:MAG: MATE family efflux transporter [Alphaproteobacteria bacterium]|uniref:Multidrug-efflux transporter n=1 Tax=Pseudorhizobium pelagicum TaxID=1509405 RepID=A0A922P2J4_9HYPH|nr:MATE family efflux transporter [Pseudorhizobium pelagicum]MBU1315132.1 MATE family efflux transporter [Alphaproteobacteria bacterium]KEQ08944.1 multidrug transporter MatE [Pseudorhizobium pelagicum]KEQ09934.1 multidrug transporter MatE [Pseudorhizobium pelagicum]MBU1550463.1 MATE family efflux transporter [Alphaproteobacteria bacterium]MBU2338599.1 MATE family efflux transporter [Alphaproteobacteria bacterium]